MVVERFFRGSRQLRILFVTIAVLGFFPYSCRQDLCNPIFSLKLLLWDIFVQLSLIFGTYLQIVKVFLGLVTQDVGGWAFGFSLNLAAISQVLVSILMLIRSKKLVSMLKDLPAVLEELEEKERTLGFEVIDIVILVVIACVTAFSFLYFSLGGKLVTAEIIYLNICSLFGMSSIGCLLVLFRKLPRLLSQEIQRRVEDAVVACIENSVSDANTEGQEGDLAPLHALEQEVRKLSNVRDKVTRGFFASATFFIAVCVVLAIAMFYATLRGFLVNGGTVMLVFMSIAMIYYMYSIGQSCSDQVNDAVETLQNLSCNFSSIDMKTQVYHVITCLQPLRKFDMCGWYTLDYPSLVTVGSVVVTYLVILLQVGGLQLQN